MGMSDILMWPATTAWNDIIQNQPGRQYTDAWLTQYFKDYDKNINDYFMNKQMDYNTYMSNTAYQRAVADMEAAGINPASLGSGSFQSAATPGVSGQSASSGVHSHSDSGASASDLITSLFNSMISNSREAQKIAGREMLDNAKHAHKLEEINENAALKYAMTKDSNAQQHLNKMKQIEKEQKFKKDLNQSKSLEALSKADYYDEKAKTIRGSRSW